jgi:hypothetical protein
MSLDTRELILARMFDILDGMRTDILLPTDERFVTVARNRGKLDNDKLPAGYLLDGDEDTTMAGTGRGRVRMQPVFVTMRPQVFVVLKVTGAENKKAELIGPLLNKYRGNIMHRFATDTGLLALLGAEGDFGYVGMTTDLKTGMPMDGQAQLNFTVRHLVNPYA